MRRLILFTTLLSLLTGCATIGPPPARFRILQINDVYKIEGLEGGKVGGVARLRTLRRHLESDGTALLVLHAGDLLYPSVMSKYLEAKPMIDVLNMLDGDASTHDPALIVTFGNHEFDATEEILLARLRDSRFAWVSTNALHCDPDCDRRFPGVEETIIRDIDGVRVGVFGLTYPLKRSYVETTSVNDAARAAAANLRNAGADFIIAVTHQEMPDDISMVREVPGIDLVVGGHDHIFKQDRVNGTWITKADADALSVIVYDVTVPRCRGPRCRAATVPLRITVDDTTSKDERMDLRVQTWLGELAAKLGGNETLGMTRNLLEGVEPAIRKRETALGNLLADVARNHMQTDIAMINGGGIRINDNIPPGPITSYDMEGIFFYGNRLVAFRASGAQVLELLRNSVSRLDGEDGRFMQVSGIRFAYSQQGETFAVAAEDVTVNGQPLDLARSYTVATTDFTYLRGTEDGYELFGTATRPPKVNEEREIDFRQAVEQWIRAAGTVDVKIEGRIVQN